MSASLTELGELAPSIRTSVGEVDRARSPRDEMFAGDEAHYLGVGLSALRNVRLALCAAEADEPRRILDLGCGHGRVLRFLRAAWPAAHITACDVQRDAVDFCARVFGARPLVSRADLRALELPAAAFDLVWVGSVLTHLDLGGWSALLDLAARALRARGLLVFSSLGRYGAYRMRQGVDYGLDPSRQEELLARFDRAGFAHSDYPGRRGYGIALASPAFVTAELAPHASWRLVSYAEMAWDHHHDVVACQRLA